MTCHLSHRIPWNLLSSCINTEFRKHYTDSDYTLKYIVNESDISKIDHFCRVFHDTIKEFSQSMMYSDYQERFNLKTWDNGQLKGGFGHLGVILSVMCGYLKLNLLFTDIGFKIFTLNDDWVMSICMGKYDGGHPDWIATKVRKLFLKQDNCNDPQPEFITSLYEPHIKQDDIQSKYIDIPINSQAMTLINELRKIYFRILVQFYKFDCPDNPDELLGFDAIKNNLSWMLNNAF